MGDYLSERSRAEDDQREALLEVVSSILRANAQVLAFDAKFNLMSVDDIVKAFRAAAAELRP